MDLEKLLKETKVPNETINEIFKGATVWYSQKNVTEAIRSFSPSVGGYISMSAVIHDHLSKGRYALKITKIELTPENKRKLYEYLASL